MAWDIFGASALQGEATGALSGAAAGSAFGPIGAGIGAAIGLGASIFGSYESYQGAQQANQAQTQITQLEQQAEAQRHQAMELTAKRQQMQVLRNNQIARSMSLNSATNQGAQFGSGYQGGLGQIQGDSGTNLVGINQNLEIGENIFGINNQISQQRIALGNAGTRQATGAGISSLGRSVGTSIEPLSRLFGFGLGSRTQYPASQQSDGGGYSQGSPGGVTGGLGGVY